MLKIIRASEGMEEEGEGGTRGNEGTRQRGNEGTSERGNEGKIKN
jgi:hypothetical protein